jgi:hypothetical protein
VAQPAEAPRKITAAEKEFKAFRTLRVARANQRHEGVRKARAAKVSTNLDVGSAIFNLVFFLIPIERGGGSRKEEVNLSLLSYLLSRFYLVHIHLPPRPPKYCVLLCCTLCLCYEYERP